jgi:uncharacterized membrane protein
MTPINSHQPMEAATLHIPTYQFHMEETWVFLSIGSGNKNKDEDTMYPIIKYFAMAIKHLAWISLTDPRSGYSDLKNNLLNLTHLTLVVGLPHVIINFHRCG